MGLERGRVTGIEANLYSAILIHSSFYKLNYFIRMNLHLDLDVNDDLIMIMALVITNH